MTKYFLHVHLEGYTCDETAVWFSHFKNKYGTVCADLFRTP